MSEKRSGIEFLRSPYFRAVDYWLIIPVLLLTTIGLFVLNEVYIAAVRGYPQNIYTQAVAAFIGAAIALIICLLDAHFLKLIGWIIYSVSMLLLLIIPFDGYQAVSGADAWIRLGGGLTLQPSELMKIGLVILSAFFLQDISSGKISMKKGLLLIAVMYAPPAGLITLQPDMGTLMVIVFSLCCMFFIWGIKYRYIFLALSGAIVASPFVFSFLLEPYQQNRILSTFFPGADPIAGENVRLSQMAISLGGLTGSRADTPVNVPVKSSDFIFSAVSEYMGFIGTTAVILLALFFLLRCLYVASQTKEKSHSFIVVGLMATFAFHYIENMGMAIGLLPVTGIPLPFISGGGTALLVNFVSVGIIMNISMCRNLQPRF